MGSSAVSPWGCCGKGQFWVLNGMSCAVASGNLGVEAVTSLTVEKMN